MRLLAVVSLVIIESACSAPKKAPIASDSEVVAWAALAGPMRPGRGDSMLFDVDVKVTVTGGWHVYSLTQPAGGPTPMKISVSPSPPYSLAGKVVGPAPVKAQDDNFGIETETYSGEQIFHVPVSVAASSTISPPPLELKIRSQACNDRLCLPAKTTTLTVQPARGTT